MGELLLSTRADTNKVDARGDSAASYAKKIRQNRTILTLIDIVDLNDSKGSNALASGSAATCVDTPPEEEPILADDIEGQSSINISAVVEQVPARPSEVSISPEEIADLRK